MRAAILIPPAFANRADDHGARTALRHTAAEFDALSTHLVAQDVQQRFRAVRDGHGRELVVYVKIES